MSEDLVAQAGEYVLGTLDAAERSVFAARVAGDPAARAAVAAWQRRFAPLADLDGEVTPNAATWERIASRLRPAAGAASVAAPVPPEPPPSVADPGGADFGVENLDITSLQIASLMVSRDRWRAAFFAAAALIAATAGVVALSIGTPRRDGEGRTLVAAINPGGNKPALLIRVDLATRRVSVRPIAAEAPPGRSLELWAVNSAAPPRSLGLVGAAPADLAMPAGTAAGTTFAVSVEPEGGSKSGAPTGPVIYTGQLVEE